MQLDAVDTGRLHEALAQLRAVDFDSPKAASISSSHTALSACGEGVASLPVGWPGGTCSPKNCRMTCSTPAGSTPRPSAE